MNEVGVKDFLRALGVSPNSMRTSRGWVNCECPLAPYTHGAGRDEHPSFGISVGEGRSVYYCLGASSRVMTDEGTFPIKDLSGKTCSVLTRGGKWVGTQFKSYGRQRLYEIKLVRNEKKKVIYATGEHRWFVVGHSDRQRTVRERATKELRPGNILEACRPRPKVDNRTKLDVDGVRRGFVYGDGTVVGRIGSRVAQADFHGGKDKFMIQYFDDCKITPKGEIGRFHAYTSYVNRCKKYSIRGFDSSWKKSFPYLKYSDGYLASFLAGWIAADGHVDRDGLVMLNSARKEDLQFARDLATKIGLVTFEISRQMRIGIGQKKPTALYRVNFAREGFPSSLLLNPKHKERFDVKNSNYVRLRWRVDSVRRTNKVEEVYCCEVPETHAFVIEDFILTGNCFGCSPKAQLLEGLLHNIFIMSGEYPWEAAKVFIHEENWEEEDGPLPVPDRWLDFKPTPAPLPKEILSLFPRIQWKSGNPTASACKEYLEGRGVPKWVQHLYEIRIDPKRNCLVFSLTDPSGRIFMLRERSIREKKMWTVSPELLGMKMEFPKLRDVGVWFGMHHINWSKPVMLVEGEIKVMRLAALGFFNAIASATSSVSEAQMDAVSSPITYMGYDADKAGALAHHRITERIKDRTVLYELDWSLVGRKDPDELKNKRELEEVLKNARPI